MTQLDYLNVMLMYIDEEPVTDVNATYPAVTYANLCLKETIEVYNNTTNSSATNILEVSSTIRDYIVKRASLLLYTRRTGFEGTNKDVLDYELLEAMNGVNKFVLDTLYSNGSSDIISYVNKLLYESKSLEQSWLVGNEFISRLNEAIGVYNTATSSSATNITEVNSLAVNYIIRRAGRMVYETRTDFNQMNDVAIEKELSDAMGNIRKMALDTLTTLNNDMVAFIKTMLNDLTSIEEVYSFIEGIEDKYIDIREETKRRVLLKGWGFNSYDIALAPNANNEIEAPEVFLNVDGVDNNNLVVREWKLYDSVNHTFTFTSSVNCRVIHDTDFDDCPVWMKEYILAYTDFKFLISIGASSEKYSAKLQDSSELMIEAVRRDTNNTDFRLFDDTTIDVSDSLTRDSL